MIPFNNPHRLGARKLQNRVGHGHIVVPVGDDYDGFPAFYMTQILFQERPGRAGKDRVWNLIDQQDGRVAQIRALEIF